MRLRVTSKADPWFIVGMLTFELSFYASQSKSDWLFTTQTRVTGS